MVQHKFTVMRTQLLIASLLGSMLVQLHPIHAQARSVALSEEINRFANESERLLNPEQKGMINQVAWKISKLYGEEGGVDIALIDLDNSTISQLAEVWLNTALLYHGIEDIRVISGGLKADGLNTDALLTLEDWGFRVISDEDQTVPILTVDYGRGRWNLFAKNIDPAQHADLILFVDDHCETALHEDTLEQLDYVNMILGTSPGCIEDGVYRFTEVNREIAAKMFELVRRLEINLIQQNKMKKQRKAFFR